MKYVIEKNSGKYMYLQLYEQLRADIILGVFAYGQKIPSKRTLSAETGVSVVCVEHACALLEDEGYIAGKERSGYVVVFRRSDLYNPAADDKKTRKPTSPANFDRTLFPFSVYAKALRRVLTNYGENLYLKTPNEGASELREAISKYLMRNKGFNVSSDRIVIGAGAEWLYMLILQILGKRTVAAIEEPSYEKIEQIYKANGAKIKKLRLGADGILTKDLEACAADLLHVTPYRSYPTGISTSASKRREYLAWADKNDAYILEDDYLSEFSLLKKSEETIFSIAEHDNVIYVNSFAKTVSPTLRVAYAVLPEKLIGRYRETVGFYSCPVPTPEQYLLAELIECGDFERHLNRVRRMLRKEQ